MFSLNCSPGSATLPALLLTMVWLAACGARAQPGSPATSPDAGTRNVAAVGDVLTREQIDRIQANSMERLLDGRFAGVQVVRRRNEVFLRIRGEGEPLLVVNGLPAASIGLLWDLNPADVEQIEILKDNATSIYGLDGGNGVVLITTRSY